MNNILHYCGHNFNIPLSTIVQFFMMFPILIFCQFQEIFILAKLTYFWWSAGVCIVVEFKGLQAQQKWETEGWIKNLAIHAEWTGLGFQPTKRWWNTIKVIIELFQFHNIERIHFLNKGIGKCRNRQSEEFVIISAMRSFHLRKEQAVYCWMAESMSIVNCQMTLSRFHRTKDHDN